MAVSHHYDTALEDSFIVVQWDQRGAGKSNPKGFDETTMTNAQFIRDCHELTRYLKKVLGREKIYLLGHSWGTQLGIQVAGLYPEDYLAYIGVSQVINALDAHVVGERWLRETLISENKKRDIRKLDKLGPPPYRDHEDFVRFIHLIDKYGGSFDISFGKLLRIAIGSPYYSLSDMKSWLNGANRGSGPLWEESLRFDAKKDIPHLDLPVLLIAGTGDYNTPIDLVEEYASMLQTPSIKRVVRIEGASHTPQFKDPEGFARILRDFRKEVEGDRAKMRGILKKS